MNWAMQQRQLFITEHLEKFGTIRRSDIMGKFGITISNASRDIQIWIANNEGKIIYNKNAKRYEAVK
jgi:DeoR/GlpR family transcriptional regulator of sugar metabolism